MKNLVVKLAILLLPIGLVVVLANYMVDPANIFAPPSYIGGIAAIMSKGHNVDNLSNYNERLLQEQVLKMRDSPIDVMVLGSSRIMEIGSDFFPGQKVLNCGVSHGNINDLISIVGLADSLGKLPAKVVIGLDHFLICKGGSTEWESLAPYEAHFRRTYDAAGSTGSASAALHSEAKLGSLFSLDYFKSSLEFVAGRKSKKYSDVGTEIPKTYGRFKDGTVAYSAAYQHPDVTKMAADARSLGLKSGLPEPDPERIRLLDRLLEVLQNKKITVEFILIPYHPEFYKAVKEKQSERLHTFADIFQEIAGKAHVPMTGSFDPVALGMPVEYFYDQYHCSKAAIKEFVYLERPALAGK